MLLCGMAVDADAVMVDGIDYGILYDGTAVVSGNQSTDASEVIIPEKISIDGKEYIVTELAYGCFKGKTNLKSVKLPETINVIGRSAFENCTDLSQINIPDAVTNIDVTCFEKCTALTSIELSESLELLGTGAFMDCSNLVSITIKNNLRKIDYNCFYGCKTLESINLHHAYNARYFRFLSDKT